MNNIFEPRIDEADIPLQKKSLAECMVGEKGICPTCGNPYVKDHPMRKRCSSRCVVRHTHENKVRKKRKEIERNPFMHVKCKRCNNKFVVDRRLLGYLRRNTCDDCKPQSVIKRIKSRRTDTLLFRSTFNSKQFVVPEGTHIPYKDREAILKASEGKTDSIMLNHRQTVPKTGKLLPIGKKLVRKP